MSFKIEFPDVTRIIGSAGRSYLAGTDEAHKQLGEDIKTDGQKNCPVATGNLRDSARTTYRERRGGQSLVTIRFGSRKAWYAALVHNDPEQSKNHYLDKAVTENIDDFPGIIDARTRGR